ncbi:hypothetical protein H5410_062487 [Solanum commersonii]|uniref:ABC-2 type transporter transmembrane domain-containing protein n=1 Tax=Solanum commersonii TaxID=4109 RepID=A0A9J5WAT4_SOLCO|nr:hypothetical protein H5410_062487 [Solanum commersonii]
MDALLLDSGHWVSQWATACDQFGFVWCWTEFLRVEEEEGKGAGVVQIYFVNFFSFLYFTYYEMMIVATTPKHHVASIFAAAFFSLFNLFSGFFIPRPISLLFHTSPK